MIPIIPAEDLAAFPDFAAAWEFITSSLLDQDSATRSTKAARGKEWARGRQESERAGWNDSRAPTSCRGGDDDGEDATLGEGADDTFLGDDAHISPDQVNASKGKPETNVPDFEEALRDARVVEMKGVILREVLAQLPCLPEPGTGSETGHHSSSNAILLTTGRAPRSEISDITNCHRGHALSKDSSIMDQQNGHPGEEQEMKPPDLHALRNLILLISTYLNSSSVGASGKALTKKEEDLLSEDIDRFTSNLAVVADGLSLRLTALEQSLLTLSNLGLDGDTPALSLMSLLDSLESQVEGIHTLQNASLPTSLSELRQTLMSLLALQRRLLNLQLQHLETSKHGVLSRFYTSKMSFLSTVAQTMALKTQVMVLEARKEVETSSEAERRRETTKTKMEAMLEDERGLDERIRLLEGVVDEYGALDSGGSDGTGRGVEIMRKLGRRYAEIEGDKDAVRGDIERLEKGKA